MTAYSKESGFRANCTLQPPSISRAEMMSRAAERSIWNSRLARVWVGATTMESPVWTPTGSMFSMEQMVMTLPAESRMTSNSISFQPAMHRSMSTSWTRDRFRPRSQISRRETSS